MLKEPTDQIVIVLENLGPTEMVITQSLSTFKGVATEMTQPLWEYYQEIF